MRSGRSVLSVEHVSCCDTRKSGTRQSQAHAQVGSAFPIVLLIMAHLQSDVPMAGVTDMSSVRMHVVDARNVQPSVMASVMLQPLSGGANGTLPLYDGPMQRVSMQGGVPTLMQAPLRNSVSLGSSTDRP